MKISKDNYLYYTALLVWAVFSIGILVYFTFNVGNTVFTLFYRVGSTWNNRGGIYSGECVTYSYWPGFALILALLAKLPYTLGSLLWSILNIGTIFLALLLLGRAVFEQSLNRIGALLLLALPLVWEGIFNQQSNSLVAGIALLGALALYRERYFVASLLLLFASVSKIAPAAFALLFLVMYPWKLWWRYVLALVIILALPFIFAGADYVMAQHLSWVDFLQAETNERWAYRDFFVLYEVIVKGKMTTNLMPDFPQWYRGVQLLGAAILCGVCLWIRYIQHLNRKAILLAVVMSGSVWWLLLGPSTEIATCVAGAGIAGFGVILAFITRSGRWLMLPGYICVALGSSGDYEWNMQRLVGEDWIFATLPFGASLMFIWLCFYAYKSLALTTDFKGIRLELESEPRTGEDKS